MIRVNKFSFSAADKATTLTTPVLAIPAPPAGFVNVILGGSVKYSFGGVINAVGFVWRFGNPTIAVIFPYIDNVTEAQGASVHIQLQNLNSQLAVFPTEDDFFIFSNVNYTTGNSDSDIYITWEEKELDV